jgi:hypothetical protein
VVRHAPDTQRPGFSSSRNLIFSFICSLRYLQLPAKKSKQNLVCYLCTASEACTLGSIALSLVYDWLKYQYKLVKHVQNYCHAAEALLGVQGSWLDQMVGTPTSRCVLSLTFLPCDIRLMQERTDNTFQSGFCVSLSVPTHRYKISCILVAVGVKDQNYQTMSEIFDADWALFFRRLFVWVQNLNYFWHSPILLLEELEHALESL